MIDGAPFIQKIAVLIFLAIFCVGVYLTYKNDNNDKPYKE